MCWKGIDSSYVSTLRVYPQLRTRLLLQLQPKGYCCMLDDVLIHGRQRRPLRGDREEEAGELEGAEGGQEHLGGESCIGQ
jgi:hypothetical protein